MRRDQAGPLGGPRALGPTEGHRAVATSRMGVDCGSGLPRAFLQEALSPRIRPLPGGTARAAWPLPAPALSSARGRAERPVRMPKPLLPTLLLPLSQECSAGRGRAPKSRV